MARAAFLDEAVLEVRGGQGGDGTASFHRTRRQPRGAPDGGSGGAGGSVYARSLAKVGSLADYVARRLLVAGRGGHGGGNQRHGANGDDLWLDMPAGTDIYDAETGDLHASLLADGDVVLLAGGGEGGRGNMSYKSSTNRSPKQVTRGSPGEARIFCLSLRLLADVGLLGLPNAGKSSLLRAVSNSTSAVGEYPFTTLRPYLGMVELDDHSRFKMADIPGIIPGAGAGAGLGLRFLRHVTRTKALLHLVDCGAGGVAEVDGQVAAVHAELAQADDSGALLGKPRLLVLSKVDKLDRATTRKLARHLRRLHPELSIHCVSSRTGQGVASLVATVARLLRDLGEGTHG